jgi:hypothetical protein
LLSSSAITLALVVITLAGDSSGVVVVVVAGIGDQQRHGVVVLVGRCVHHGYRSSTSCCLMVGVVWRNCKLQGDPPGRFRIGGSYHPSSLSVVDVVEVVVVDTYAGLLLLLLFFAMMEYIGRRLLPLMGAVGGQHE